MQTEYKDNQEKAFAGLLTDMAPNYIHSLLNEEAAAVGFGRGVLQGTADDQFLLPSGDILKFQGITIHSHNFENQGVDGIPVKGMASTMKKGVCWVVAEDTVAKGEGVFLRHTGGNEGGFRSDVDGANATQITGAEWMSSAGAGEFAQVYLP